MTDNDESYACDCLRLSFEDAFDYYDVVFAGKVLQIDDPRKDRPIKSSFDWIDVAFEVKEFWKGELDRVIFIRTVRDGASCGYNFTLDEEYLVYAVERGEWLETGMCSRTAPLDSTKASQDIALLGDGTVNRNYGKSEILIWNNPIKPGLIIAYISGAAIVVIVSVVILWRRLRRR